jgi:hypothetical protein
MGNPAPPPPTNTASTSDVLSAIKNIVLALATAAQNYLNVQGIINAANISAPTVVSSKAGRVATVSILTAGSAPGTIYDGATLSATTKPIVILPNTVGVFTAPMPVSFGILVVPGSGQVLSIAYS